MSWTLLPDNFTEELIDKLDLSRDAQLVHIHALVLCNRMSSQGTIAEHTVRGLLFRLGDYGDYKAITEELVDSGLWQRVVDRGRVDDVFEIAAGVFEIAAGVFEIAAGGTK